MIFLNNTYTLTGLTHYFTEVTCPVLKLCTAKEFVYFDPRKNMRLWFASRRKIKVYAFVIPKQTVQFLIRFKEKRIVFYWEWSSLKL